MGDLVITGRFGTANGFITAITVAKRGGLVNNGAHEGDFRIPLVVTPDTYIISIDPAGRGGFIEIDIAGDIESVEPAVPKIINRRCVFRVVTRSKQAAV